MLNKDEIKILRTIRLVPTFILVLSLIAIIFIFQNNNSHFNNEVERIRIDSIQEKKLLIKNEVLSVHELIKNEKSRFIDNIKKELKERVHEAHTIASSIYRNNQDKTSAEIKLLISDALRDIRFNQGRGYFFICQNDGLSVMHPILPHIQNTNLWDFQDVKGSFIIRNISTMVTTQGEGFLRWWWKKPTEDDTVHEKIGYSKSFAPYDWFIGTGEYVIDYEKELKAKVLERISQVTYGKNGYIFVVDSSGVYLNHINPSYIGQNRIKETDSNGFFVTQKIINIAEQGEGYLSYVGSIKPSSGLPAKKTSFVKNFTEWNWAIGTGAYIDDIENDVLSKKLALNNARRATLLQTLLIGTAITFILFLISLMFANHIKKRFLRYNVNVTAKTLELNELNHNLEDKVTERTKALASSNEELELALISLTTTQTKLIASEKMASMVGLVSGVAHELNTPLGIMVTSVSQLENELEKLLDKIKSQQLSRKDLQRSEEAFKLGTELLNSSLNKSIQLVKSFKSLSIDDHPEIARKLSLNTLVQSLSDSYERRLAAHKTQLSVTFESEIIITSYKETIIEVITQLIENSLTHAFKDITAPLITMHIKDEGEYVEIHYVDNGLGLGETDSDKVFDLFYTTKRNTSCTGLGMPIVYNQITQKLLGSIESTQQEGQGISFTIKIAKRC